MFQTTSAQQKIHSTAGTDLQSYQRLKVLWLRSANQSSYVPAGSYPAPSLEASSAEEWSLITSSLIQSENYLLRSSREKRLKGMQETQYLEYHRQKKLVHILRGSTSGMLITDKKILDFTSMCCTYRLLI